MGPVRPVRPDGSRSVVKEANMLRHRHGGSIAALTFLLLGGAASAFWLWGCGSGTPESPGSGSGTPIGGQMNVANFTLPAGTTRTATSDLTINASGNIRIDGTLLISPGVSVALLAKGATTITGVIMPDSSAAARSRVVSPGRTRDDGGHPLVIDGENITISNENTGDGLITLSPPPGEDLLIATDDNEGTVTISREIHLVRADDASSTTENGGNGGSIEIGTSKAIQAVKAKGSSAADMPASIVVVRSNLSAGTAGKGFTETAGTLQGGVLMLHGTTGGNGGNILFTAAQSVKHITKAGGNQWLSTDGGEGGSVGTFDHILHAPDGTQPGQKGADVNFATGDGGNAGKVVVTAPTTDLRLNKYNGQMGGTGRVYLSAGNGGPGGDGGSIIGTVGTGSLYAWVFSNGGNGGNSADRAHPGGNGGTISLSSTRGNVNITILSSVEITNCGNGGKGFNGCASGGNGTDGGSAGKIAATGLTLTFNGIKLPSRLNITSSFVPGSGGDGTPAGKAGQQGKDEAGKLLGTPAVDGGGCPVATYQIVEVPAASKINDNGDIAGTNARNNSVLSIALTPHGTTFLTITSVNSNLTLYSPIALNNNGAVLGQDLGIDNSHGSSSLWTPNTPHTSTGTVTDFTKNNFSGYGLNDSGAVVGIGQGIGTAIWRNGQFQSLMLGSPYAINSSGKVFGSFQTLTNGTLGVAAYRTAPYSALNPATDLLYGPGGTSIIGGTPMLYGHSINANGDCVNDGIHALLWTGANTQAKDLGTLGGAQSNAAALNDNLDVVGSSYIVPGQNSATGGETHAFLCRAGGPMQDLNNLIDKNSGWVLTAATDINNFGEIVGRGGHSGGTGFFLLIPPAGRAAVSRAVYSPH
jgi:hypothetical protein